MAPLASRNARTAASRSSHHGSGGTSRSSTDTRLSLDLGEPPSRVAAPRHPTVLLELREGVHDGFGVFWNTPAKETWTLVRFAASARMTIRYDRDGMTIGGSISVACSGSSGTTREGVASPATRSRQRRGTCSIFTG